MMSGRRRSERSRRAFLGGLGAAAFLGVLGSAVRGLFGRADGAESAVAPRSAATVAPRTETTTTTTTEATTTTTEATEATTTTTTSVVAAGREVLVIEKAGWGAAPEGGGFVEHQIDGIVVHHTAVVLGANANAPSRIRGHQAYHQEQGWPDLAYHLMIDRNGNVYEGRPMWAKGDTFTDYDPAGFFLPCLEGDFNSETPSAAQLEALAAVCAWAVNEWALDPGEIVGHRDEASTTCPGGNLYPHISGGDLAVRVRRLAATGTSLGYLRGTDATQRVAAIEAGG